MSEDITFSDWSERLDAGTSDWLPAYGFQQPSQLQEALLQQDFMNHDGGNQQTFLFLETILEETSDDLRSESDYSGPAGWPDSDTDSVIHVPNALGKSCAVAEWSGSERDIAIPKKRRRRLINNDPGVHDDDDEEEDEEEEDLLQPTVSSRSSSLLQFETLERHCETAFRTSASSEPFPISPSVGSSFSFDSLETSRWRFSGSGDSLNEEEGSSLTSSCSSTSSDMMSDEDNIARSFSSRSGNDSFRSSTGLKSHRSFDSLVSSQSEKLENTLLSGEFSQSLNNNSIAPEEEPEPIAPSRAFYKTMECLTDVGGITRKPGVKIIAKCDNDRINRVIPRKDSNDGIKCAQRSAENLSEDSGFGEHIPRGSLGTIRRTSSSGVFTIEEKEDDYTSSSSYGSDISSGEKNETERNDGVDVKILPAPSGEEKERGWDDVSSKFSHCWQSAPDLLKPGSRGAQSAPERAVETNCVPEVRPSVRADLCHSRRLTTSLVLFTIKDDDELIAIPENKTFTMEIEGTVSKKMTTKKAPVSSTPNLYSPNEFSDDEKETLLKVSRGPTLLSRSLSFKHNTEKDSTMVKSSSKGSNVQITTSFINLSTTNSGSNKGVHFCPVVSEVSWQESFSDVEDDPSEEGEGSTIWVSKPDPVEEEEEEKRAVPELKVEPPSGEKARLTTPVSAALPPRMEPKQNKSKLGGFFQRFSLRRLSGRDKKRKEKKKENLPSPQTASAPKHEEEEEDVRIIPLHPPPEEGGVLPGKPPLPPLPPLPPRSGRRRTEEGAGGFEAGGGSVMTSRGRDVLGLLETDIDSPEPASNKKARSLLDLGESHLAPCPQQDPPPDNRAKSMEFLLDKENQHAAKPPENELQKVGGGDRVMSEHQLRVQRSLQKLDIPEWYKNSQLPAQGFLLKRNSDTTHWPGLSSKTTSLSSLGSAHSATPRSPTSNLLSPSPTPSVHTFSRWSTSRLNSNATSTSTSPCGSARSSFNYRQPYLGWRSQERISRPRTPAERLAAGLLPQKPQHQHVPNLSEVHTSIKEVTSAIANYVSGAKGGEDRLSPAPRWDTASSRSASPRGSTGRLCWLESSFVGSRPIDVPETPVTLTATPAPDHPRTTELYLDLTPTNRPKPVAVNDS